jgi:type II secretory pathway component PulF
MHRTIRLTKTDILHFTFQLSILMNQNYLLPDGISLIKATTPDKKIRNWLEKVMFHLQEGESFVGALQKETRGLSHFYLSVVRSGESSGSLGIHMKRLYDFLRARNRYESKMKKASFYPVFLMILTVCISLLMLIFLLPMLQSMAETLQVSLPASVTRLLGLIHFLRQYAWISVVVIILAGLAGRLFYQKYRYIVHGFTLLVPLVGPWIRKNNLFLFFQELSLLLKDQIPVEEAIPIASQSIHNIYLRDQIELSSIPLQNGKTITDTLRKFPGKDTFLLSMIKSGEESNQLCENIDFALQVLEQELEERQERFVSSIEPVMLLVIGAVVLLLVVNLYFPIFQMINSVDMISTL